jgi:hypothetical protein
VKETLKKFGFKWDDRLEVYQAQFPGNITIGVMNEDDEPPNSLFEKTALLMKDSKQGYKIWFPQLIIALNWIEKYFSDIQQDRKAKFFNDKG